MKCQRSENIPAIAIWLDESEGPVVARKLPWRNTVSSLMLKMHTSANAALSCDFVPSSEVLGQSLATTPPASSSSSQLAALASPVVKAMASAKLPCNGS